MDTNAKKVDEIFAAWDKQDTPGCAIAVVKNSNIIYKQGYGMAKGNPAKVNDRACGRIRI